MKFLEAQSILRAFRGGEPLPFRLAMSGTADQLDVFLRATAASKGRAAEAEKIPFNTLPQFLARPRTDDTPEAFLLLPWDFVAELDWRSGVPPDGGDPREMIERAGAVADKILARRPATVLYLPASATPIMTDIAEQNRLLAAVHSLAGSIAHVTLDPQAFSLGSYLNSGCPIAGASLGAVASSIVEGLSGAPAEDSYKVLVTDFDNVLWSGVVGEDGPEGVAAAAEGRGYRHFIYQTVLVALRRAGVLLVGVTRNDPEDALAPFRRGGLPLAEDDFIAVVASYHAKSAQLRRIASDLNLGVDAFVFVDDNPIELAEVAAELPGLRCVPFPTTDDDLPPFLDDLRRLFSRRAVTREDMERTDLYRRRLEGLAPVESSGAGLSDFLRGLEMRLTVHDRSRGIRERALQLINKTNQFNLNGIRLTEAELESLLGSGGSLWGASLWDRTGSHGEILACLISASGVVESLVLSCRVFQRRVEYAFFCRLIQSGAAPRAFRFKETARNEPIRQFLSDPAFCTEKDGLVLFDAARFLEHHRVDLDLFEVNDGS